MMRLVQINSMDDIRSNFKLFALLLIMLPFSGMLSAQHPSYVYAYVSQDNVGNVQISTVDPGDNTSSILTTFTTPNQRHIVHTAVNADGSWIALVPFVAPEEVGAIQLINPTTLETREIPANLSFLMGGKSFTLAGPQQRFVWSPDGDKLAFTSFHEGTRDVYVYSLAQDSLVKITDNSDSENRIVWSNDNTQLAILKTTCTTSDNCIASINIVDAANPALQATVIMLPSGGSSLFEYEICHMKWSPDDRYIAFAQICDASLYSNAKEVYLLDVQQQTIEEITSYILDTTIPEGVPFLTRFGGYALLWTDLQTLLIGSAIIASTETDFTTQTVSYSLSSGSLTTLSTTAMAQEWTANPMTNQLAYRANTGSYFYQQGSSVKIATYNNNMLEEVYSVQAGCDLSWSPDGLWLAATNRGLPLESCSDPIQGIQFVNGQNGALSQYNVASTIIDQPIGWVIGKG